MNAILHLVKKDLRVGGSSILIFLAALVLTVAVQAPGLPETAMVVQIGRNLLPMVTFLILLACVVMAVLEDPVAGTSAFWLTRPARAGTLVAAKALLLGSMVLVYLAGQCVILAMNGGVGLTPYLLGGFVLGTLPLIAAVFAAASMANDPTRFFVTVAIGIVATGVLAIAGHFLVALFLPGVFAPGSGEPDGVLSVRARAGALALVGALGLAWHQYATRRTARTGLLAGLSALVLAGLVAPWPSGPFLAAPPVTVEKEAALGLDRFQPAMRGDRASRFRSIHEDRAGGETVRILLNVPVSTTTLPEGWVVRRMRGHVELTTAEGKELRTGASANLSSQDRGLKAPEGFRQAGRDVGGLPETEFTLALLDLPEEEYRALGEATLSGTVELSLTVARRGIIMEFPLAEGAGARHEGETWRLLSRRPGIASTTTVVDGVVEHLESLGGVAVDLEVCAPDLWLHQAAGGRRPPLYLYDARVLLLNRGQKEWMRRGGGGSSFNGGQPGVPVTRNNVSLNFDASAGIEPAWLDGATLAIVGDSDETTLRRTLEVDGVRVLQE